MWLYVVSSLLVIILVAVLSFVLPVLRRRRVLKPLPGMEEHFFFGHSLHFLNKSAPEILEMMCQGFKDLGRVWKFFMMHETLLMVADPKVLEVRT